MDNKQKAQNIKAVDKGALRSAGDEVTSDLTRAIWDAAGKFKLNRGGKDLAKSKIQEAEIDLWTTEHILTFKEFCMSPEHMNFPPLSERQLMVADYMFGDDPKKMFDNNRNTAVLSWGKGAGKDTLSALMILYVVYILECLHNPQQFLGLPDNDNIDLRNVASTKEQAHDVFFEIFKSKVMNWSWLKSRWDIQVSGRFFSSSQKGMAEVGNKILITEDAIIFPRNIRAFSASSEAETSEGRNLLMFVLDEADAFKTSSKNRNADKIYRILRSSAASRFKKRFKCFLISYPRSINGFILRKYKESKKFLNIYSDLAATWEVKPRNLFSPDTFEFEGIQVPMDLYDEFRLDPIGANAAYCCRPPEAEELFIEDWDRVEAAADQTNAPLFEFGDYTNNGMIKKRILKHPYEHDRATHYVLILDLGLKNDPTALTLMHRDQDKIIIDFCTTWIPDKGNNIIVDMINVEEIIAAICESVNVDRFAADQWNSSLYIQKIKARGIKADTVKLSYEDYEVFKRLLYAGNIRLIKNDRLLHEIKNLQLYNGKRVDHPPEGHNDMAVTIVMGLKTLIEKDKGAMSSNMAAEGEYIGENLSESTDFTSPEESDKMEGITIEGFQIPHLDR